MVVTQLRVLTFHHLLAWATTTKQDSRHFSVKSLGGEEGGGGVMVLGSFNRQNGFDLMTVRMFFYCYF